MVKIVTGNLDNIGLMMATILVLVVFFAYMLYLIISSGAAKVEPIAYTCNTNECATNLITGNKRCPEQEGDIVTRDPSTEVCNSRFMCDNPITPYAMLSDGSTNNLGFCDEGIVCPCSRVARCPNYISATFTVVNSTSNNIIGQRATVIQARGDTVGNGGSLILNETNNTTCAIRPSLISVSNPGCGFINSSGTSNISYEDIVTCMGLPKKCNGVESQPCISGTLAFITNNSSQFKRDNINQSLLACVNGTSCPCGQVALFDTKVGSIICKSLT